MEKARTHTPIYIYHHHKNSLSVFNTFQFCPVTKNLHFSHSCSRHLSWSRSQHYPQRLATISVWRCQGYIWWGKTPPQYSLSTLSTKTGDHQCVEVPGTHLMWQNTSTVQPVHTIHKDWWPSVCGGARDTSDEAKHLHSTACPHYPQRLATISVWKCQGHIWCGKKQPVHIIHKDWRPSVCGSARDTSDEAKNSLSTLSTETGNHQHAEVPGTHLMRQNTSTEQPVSTTITHWVHLSHKPVSPQSSTFSTPTPPNIPINPASRPHF